jgi:nucleoid DNA-binding protein
MKSIGSEDFFNKVAMNSGISDVSIVRNIFYGLIRTISQELKSRQRIKLPDWGEFSLKIHRSRRFVSVNGVPGILPPKTLVKFSPDVKVKKYFYSLGKE